MEDDQPPHWQEKAFAAQRQRRLSGGSEGGHAGVLLSNRQRRAPGANVSLFADSIALPSPEDFDSGAISVSEVLKAAWQARSGTALGPDEVAVEALSVPAVAASVVPLMNGVLDGESAPTEWCKSRMVAVPNNTGALKIEEHRGISLMPCAAKLFKRVLLRRVQPVL